MAETSRKRSRKSKLVPRECLMDEDDLELQVPATKIPKNMKLRTQEAKKPATITNSLLKTTASNLEATTPSLETPEEVCDTSVLRKINASARNSLELDQISPRKFEINIEVESCEDEDDFRLEMTESELTEGNTPIFPPEETEDVVREKNSQNSPPQGTEDEIREENSLNSPPERTEDESREVTSFNSAPEGTEDESKEENSPNSAPIGMEDENRVLIFINAAPERMEDESREGNSLNYPPEGTEVVEEPEVLESEEDKPKDPPPQPIPLNLEGILQAVDNLQISNNIANKILSLYVRNTIGYEQETKLESNHIEMLIQKALNDWKDWQKRSFHRGDPLFYKCYICKVSYWHLSDLRNHLHLNHSDNPKLKVTLERNEIHECNIVAYHNVLAVNHDIETPGLCHRCGRDYEYHEKLSRYKHRYYKADNCPRYFFCCTGLSSHFATCNACNIHRKPFECEICKNRFNKYKELLGHLILSHSVRSDVPILIHYSNSKSLEKYESKYLHNCVKNVLGKNVECVHSLLSVPKNSIESHMKRLNETYMCEICGHVMLYSCMKFEHMLSHTDDFMIVNKCTTCDGLKVFVDTSDADSHWNAEHKIMDSSPSENHYRSIFVPTSCVHQSLAELDLKEQEEALAMQESNLEMQESYLGEQQSNLETQESDLDEPESDLDEKPSLLDIDESSVSAYLESSSSQYKFDSTNIKVENVVVKEEPVDSDDSTGLVIKEEPLDEADDQTIEDESQTQDLNDEIKVKQENIDDEVDEYDDLIKLNFNIEDLLVKDEKDDDDTQDSDMQNTYVFDDENSSQDSGSIPEPKVIETGSRRKKKIYKCTCGFQATHREYRAHLNYNCTKHAMKSKNFQCTKCNTGFTSMKKFLNHFEQHGYPRISCPECLQKFENFTTLGQHVTVHVRQNYVRVKTITYDGEAMAQPDYQCTKCAARVDYLDFFDHWETHIRPQPTQPSTEIAKMPHKESKIGQLEENVIKECTVRLHLNTKQCNVCLRLFNRVNECKRHIIEHMLVDAYTQKHVFKHLRCQICAAGFEYSDKYKKHMRDHASLPVYKCELCDRTFSDSSNFTKHKKVHNLEVIVCDLCGKKFQSKLSLEKHIEKHRNTTPIRCDICNKIFYFESSYRRHVRSYHEKPATEFRCVICGDRFRCLKEKWDHMWEVHEERKQKADCPICHKSFRKYSDVRAHAKSEHMMAVTVISIKSTKPPVKKHVVTVPSLTENQNCSWPKLTVGPETETLVVYESD
ncbi:hypothetical protein PYW07_012692 [Mythimna separata]|uniref:C2H2-type domain-containing protein n=1 Tax=Mythimna separata TaxID=271217 RepID=A0AAD7Y906_MYTSE|nr:hypothetical protein PYW07_012692 [Mythimna separata]